MELKHLQYVLAIAKYNNLSSAARKLFITQPALSHQLNAVEEELNAKLFIRNTHSVEITPDGEKFCRYASEVLSAMDRLYDAFEYNGASSKQTINLGLFPFFRYTPVSDLLLSYFSEKTDVIGNLRTMDNYEAFTGIKNGTVDYVIVKCLEERIPDVSYEVLDREPYYLVGPSTLFPPGKKSISMEEAAKLPLLTGAKGSHYYDDVDSFFEKFDQKYNVVFHNTLEIEWLIKMMKNGDGATFVTGAAADELTRRASLVALPVEENIETSIILAYSKTTPPIGRIADFRDYIIKSYPKYNPLKSMK